MIFKNPKKFKRSIIFSGSNPFNDQIPAVLPAMSLKDMLRTSREQTNV
jgi:hypothetical protein